MKKVNAVYLCDIITDGCSKLLRPNELIRSIKNQTFSGQYITFWNLINNYK